MIGKRFGSGGEGTGRWVLAAGLAAMAGAGFALMLLGLSGWLITASALTGAGLLATLEIFAPGAGIRAAAVGRTVSRYLERLIGHDVTFRSLSRLRQRAFAGLLCQSVAKLDAPGQGDTLNRLTRDVDAMSGWLPSVWLPAVAACGATALALTWIGFQDASFVLPVAAAMLAAALLVLWPGLQAARRPGTRLAQTIPRLRGEARRWLNGLAELISLGRADDAAQRLRQLSIQEIQARRQQRRIEAWLHGGLMAAGYLGFWLLVVMALFAYEAGRVTGPIAVAGGLLLLALVEAWLPLAVTASTHVTLKISSSRVAALSAPPADAARESAPSGSPDSAASDVPPRLQAHGLGFSFHPEDPPLLADVELTIEPGEHIVITGPSGCGKTTLGRLLAGVIAPTRGQVEISGQVAGRLPERSLRALIGWMPQRVTLFNDTLAANLRIARANADDDTLIHALEQVELSGLLQSIPGGLDGWVGEHGRAVSGGEARRIALARMVLADFPVLILDEPTAGLDAETARRVFSNLSTWMESRSLLVCAHDTKTLPRIDREFRIDHGRLEPVLSSSRPPSPARPGH